MPTKSSAIVTKLHDIVQSLLMDLVSMNSKSSFSFLLPEEVDIANNNHLR